jgi:hypothetical protein
MVWSTKPQTIYFRRSDHFFNRVEGPRITHAELTRKFGRLCRMLRIWAVHTEHVSITNANPCLKMKSSDESATDESYSEPVSSHRISTPPIVR